jgi:hypothetical protein
MQQEQVSTEPISSTSTSSRVVRHPRGDAISEGNLLEHPIFVLTNKEAKPVGANREIHPSDYVRTAYFSREGEEGERSLVIKASPHHGFPTMFGYRIMVALFEEAKRCGFDSPRIHLSRHDLAKRIGFDRPSKEDYNDLVNALQALRTLNIEYRRVWYDKVQKSHRGHEVCAGLISEFNFHDERQAATPLVLMPGTRKSASYIRISDLVFESLRAGYYNGVDLNYMNAIKRSPLAVRLYAYLTKKDALRDTYSENLQGLAAKLNLKRRSPSAICKNLIPALEILSTPVEVSRRSESYRYLESWAIPISRTHLTVKFFQSQS